MLATRPRDENVIFQHAEYGQSLVSADHGAVKMQHRHETPLSLSNHSGCHLLLPPSP